MYLNLDNFWKQLQQESIPLGKMPTAYLESVHAS